MYVKHSFVLKEKVDKRAKMALYRSPDNHCTKENKSDEDRVKTVTARVLTRFFFDLT